MQEEHSLHVDGAFYRTRLTPKYRRRSSAAPRTPLQVRALIPGTVWEVHVADGAIVNPGDPLLTIEAMKMLNPILARREGCVARVHVQPGDRVAKDALLIEFSPDE